MTNKYRIHRIFINNFKLVDSAELNFNGDDLVVLDGPNGYGKTTIFDAIELTLTGKLHRIATNQVIHGNRGAKTNIFKKKEGIPSYIVIEFKNKQSKGDKLILSALIEPMNSGKTANRSKNWGQIKRRQLDEFETDFEVIEQSKEINNSKINEYFNVKDIEKFFNVLNYVQQEESLHFLKINDADRHTLISGLIDIEKEEEDVKRFKELLSKLKNETKDLDSELIKLNNNIKILEKNIKENNQYQQTEYFSLLEKIGLDDKRDWDSEIKGLLTLEKKEYYLKEIRKIEKFVDNKVDFLVNFDLEKKQNADFQKLMEYAICGWNFKDEYEKIKKIRGKEKFIKKIIEKIKFPEILKTFSTIDITNLQKTLNITINKKRIISLIESIKHIESNEVEFSKIINELQTSRTVTKERFITVIAQNKGELQEDNCPLCGTKFNNNQELLESIERQTTVLQTMIGKNTQEKERLSKELKKTHLKVITDSIDKYLSVPENLIVEDFFKEIFIPPNFLTQINDFLNWCKQRNIDFSKQLNILINEPIGESVTAERVQNWVLEIKRLERPVDEYLELKKIFSIIFRNKKDALENLGFEDLNKKNQYINYRFNFLNDESLVKFKTERKRLIKDLEKKNVVLDKLNIITNIYKKEIKKYTTEVVKKIEIPFFIYSGRIIQEYENGNGIFIRTFEKEKFQGKNVMLFTSKADDDHDALHCLSSGQLSALVIAFMLTLNKIYGDNGLNTMLIDDPVQTMDDINSASFVDVLRNEFSDRQHILSTHELSSSLFLRYKFKRYGLSVTRINVKNELSNSNFLNKE